MLYYFLSNTICRESIGIIKTFDDEFVKEFLVLRSPEPGGVLWTPGYRKSRLTDCV